MTISKQDAVGKIKVQTTKEYLADLNCYCSNLEILEELPHWGNYYWTLKGGMFDYWYIEASSHNKPLQTGGSTEFWAISKNTGDIPSIVVTGD